MNITAVRNASVWKSLRSLFMGSLLIFLINIFFGFDNALTAGDIPRWQILIHLHGGSIGWITLSAIGIAIWVLTGQREVSQAYEGRVRALAWAAIIVFACYVPAFGLAFSRPAGFLVDLLPVFGASAVIVLWISAIFALAQLRQQEVTTTVHILAASALLVAAVGATVGMLLGMQRAIGQFLPISHDDAIGAHAVTMDTYMFVLSGAVIEWLTFGETAGRRTAFGLLQAVAWVIAAILVPVAFALNLADVLLPLYLILLLVGLVTFLGRVAWRSIRMGPGDGSPRGWAFVGTLWFVVYFLGFMYALTFEDATMLPDWFIAAFAHVAFVGTMTNLLLGAYSARTRDSRRVLAWGEPAALWTINVGLLLFIALMVAADIRLGAIVMGIGILLGVITMFLRLRASGSAAPANPA